MASPQFSEFSFGFAYTREVVATCWTALAGHPVLPSLYDEGQAGGFDVSMGLYGWTYFAQFKRADYLSRSNALWWDDHGGAYYRFPITRPRLSRQHALLLALEAQSVFNIVEYVAPRFHTNVALSAAFGQEAVIAESLRLFPRVLGPVADDQQHYVTYTSGGHPVFRSEPFAIQPPYHAGPLRDWGPEGQGQDPAAFTSQFFDSITRKLLLLARQAGVRPPQLDAAFSPMTSFGRARALGRLLIGGELIPLVTGRE